VNARYRLEQQLGRGGMATVHRAWDTELHRPVAIKVLSETLAADPGLRERFVREARAAARLSHPNVVAVFDVGDDGGLPYFVMECVDGGTLEGRGPLAPDEAVALVAQAARGLAHAHELGLVHRDVKPGNLLVRADGTVKVADFGIARATDDSRLTQAGTILGTAAYLAPEQAAGAEATPATDVYALGAVLYELLAGRPPRTVRTLADLTYDEPVTPVRDLAPAVPPAIEDVVMRCLAREPRYRPQDARALVHELEPPRRHEAPTRVQPVPRRRSRPGRALLLPAALVALLAAAAIAIAAGGDDGTSRAPQPQRVQAPARAGTPAQDARNVADWIRELGKS
jgi:serine/threonine protein kinase